MEKGMIRGKRQAVDSAYIKANASMDSLVEKEVIADSSAFVNELEENSEYKVTSTRKKLVERHHAWKEQEYKGMPGHTDHPKQVDETSMIPLTQTRMKFIMRVPSDLLKQIIYG
jgi:hypothetical protein